MGITIDGLLKIPFLSRSREDMQLIIAEGKPRPHFNMAAVVMLNDSVKSEVETREFNPEMYDQVSWLTGCETRESFFCWPCLLYNPSDSWSTVGISDFAQVIEGMSKHEESPEHISATLQLQHMIDATSVSTNLTSSQLAKRTKRNRAILKRLTDVLCNLFNKEQCFNKRKNGCQVNPDDCVQNLLFLQNYDLLDCNYIDDAIHLIKMSPGIINDIVDMISDVIKLNIKKEILKTTYASLILSDHSEISAEPQISTILRYITDGKIHERFVGFNNIGNLKFPSVICQHVSNVISQFGLSEKLISVSLDGNILPTNELPELMDNIRVMYPQTSFVPWYSHKLDYILYQSLSNINECTLFFKTINNLKIFFQKKSKRTKALEVFMFANNPCSLRRTKWFVRSQLISILNTHRKYFILFFESVIQNAHKWSSDEVAKAVGFQKILEDFKTVFLLQTFTKLFEITSSLSKILHGQSPENVFSNEATIQVINGLADKRNYGFDEMWMKTQYEVAVEVSGLQPKRIKLEEDDPENLKYRELYSLIFNHVIQEIDTRFNDLTKLKFCLSLKFNQSFDFTSSMLQQLMTVQGVNFDLELAKNELIVLRTNSTAFKNKSMYEMLELFDQSTLKSTFKCIHLLTRFFFTLPVKQTSANANSTKFQEVIKWSYIPVETGSTWGDVAVPCVELDLLQEMKKSSSFHDDVFAEFGKVSKSFELLLK